MDAEVIEQQRKFREDVSAKIAQHKKEAEETRQRWLYAFAGQALMGFCTNPNGFNNKDEAIQASVLLAQGLLEVLEKQ